ncbi:MAG: lipoyl(octanoyl) transferase LipB [Proteobacteria bacterium]|nr:lipoyl(octanoyl) transferase LipB [Pseudomonadota bacterium]
MASKKTAAGIVDLGLIDYAAAYSLQLALVERRRSGSPTDDLLLITEHPSTFTLGRRGGLDNLMVTEEFLAARQIPLVHIERGGNITYHGPGQLVLYPILHLRQAGLSVAEYVSGLEEVMICLAAASGVVADRDPRNHGVWVGDRKLGSVGIAIRHGIAFHGLALNVNLELTPFSWVNPCGLSGVRMTTLSQECGREVALDQVKNDLIGHLIHIFGRKFIPLTKDHVDAIMHKPDPFRQTQMAAPQPADRTGV